jgi:hypothetical protein
MDTNFFALVNQDSNLTFHNFWQIVDDVLGAILWA